MTGASLPYLILHRPLCPPLLGWTLASHEMLYFSSIAHSSHCRNELFTTLPFFIFRNSKNSNKEWVIT
jgi:hypothetical protein